MTQAAVPLYGSHTLPHHAFFDPAPRVHTDGPYHPEEVQLANRNHGALLETLRHDVTPAGLHYLLNHFDVPYVPDAAAWRLDVGGQVRSPLSLSIDDIGRLPQRTLRVTLECAGNGRANITPRWLSMPWMYGAVGTAEWTGAPLRHVLERAGLDADTVEVAFFGADRGFDKGIEHAYGRSLRPELALGDDVLLVHTMNGQPLPPQHGFPLRLIVPGWYGMASVKWLHRIEALAQPFDGYQQVGTYIYKATPGERGTPVTYMRVKSLMVPPGVPDWWSGRRMVEAGLVTLHGRAWSGGRVPVAKIEVGVNGRWTQAQLGPAAGHYAWRDWRFAWTATAGDHELACRATDADGKTQPLEAPFDRGGFGNNGVHRLQVTVR